MHEKGILHRDLKPNNLTWGNFNSSYNNISNYNSINNISNNLDIKTIFLIDFGLSCSFLEGGLSYKHYKIKTNLSFVGTLRYASLNSHKGIRQSRRDDLESMIYILIYFLKGKLPWQDVKAKQKEERHKLISEIKSKVTIESLCENLPSEFAELLTYVKNLEFDEKPLYSKFYAFFHNLIEKLNKEMIEEKDYSYIWETLLVDNMMRYNEYNDENLKEEAEKLILSLFADERCTSILVSIVSAETTEYIKELPASIQKYIIPVFNEHFEEYADKMSIMHVMAASTNQELIDKVVTKIVNMLTTQGKEKDAFGLIKDLKQLDDKNKNMLLSTLDALKLNSTLEASRNESISFLKGKDKEASENSTKQ